MLSSMSLTGYEDNDYLNKTNFLTKIICFLACIFLLIINHDLVFHGILLTIITLILLMTNLTSRNIGLFVLTTIGLLLPIYIITLIFLNFEISSLIGLKILIILFYLKTMFSTTSKKDLINISMKLFGAKTLWVMYVLATFVKKFIDKTRNIKTMYYLKGINYDEFNYFTKFKFMHYNLKNIMNFIKRENREAKKSFNSLDYPDKAILSFKVSFIDAVMIFLHIILIALIIIRG